MARSDFRPESGKVRLQARECPRFKTSGPFVHVSPSARVKHYTAHQDGKIVI